MNINTFFNRHTKRSKRCADRSRRPEVSNQQDDSEGSLVALTTYPTDASPTAKSTKENIDEARRRLAAARASEPDQLSRSARTEETESVTRYAIERGHPSQSHHARDIRSAKVVHLDAYRRRLNQTTESSRTTRQQELDMLQRSPAQALANILRLRSLLMLNNVDRYRKHCHNVIRLDDFRNPHQPRVTSSATVRATDEQEAAVATQAGERLNFDGGAQVIVTQGGNAAISATAGGSDLKIGKRYRDEDSGIEVIVTKPGPVTLQCNGKDMAVQGPKKTKTAD